MLLTVLLFCRYNMLSQTKHTIDTDGLNSLSYTVLKVERHRLYTNITVDVGSPNQKRTGWGRVIQMRVFS